MNYIDRVKNMDYDNIIIEILGYSGAGYGLKYADVVNFDLYDVLEYSIIDVIYRFLDVCRNNNIIYDGISKTAMIVIVKSIVDLILRSGKSRFKDNLIAIGSGEVVKMVVNKIREKM